MKITNKLGLPQVLVDAIANDDYDAGDSDTSVTTLLQPPRKVALGKQYKGQLIEDASDRIWALMGQSVHKLLEMAGPAPGRIIEQRFFGEMEGWKVSGQVDLIETDEGVTTLSDWKYMSVWEVIHANKYEGGVKPEKTAQLNMLKWLGAGEGVQIDKLQVVCLFRDWSMTKAQTDHEYPQAHVHRLIPPVWDENKTGDYISQRVLMHQAALHDLPLCTEEDRWYSGSVYAVMKTGRKSAIRLMKTQEEADQMVADKEKGATHVEFRPGVNKHCDNYCSVSSVCEQYQEIING